MSAFDLPGTLRRIRRAADVSQRELARILDVSKTLVGEAESGKSGLDVRVLARAACTARFRLVLIDESGDEVAPMAADTVRDRAKRRFPAHLDTRYGDEDWWHGEERYAREQPWYTFDRLRYTRDYWRQRSGMPDDHLVPRPGDSPQDRRTARRRAARLRQEEEWARRLAADEIGSTREWICTCPPECEQLDDWSGRPVHAQECPCSCDVG